MKSIEKFYDAPIGGYSGVLMREKVARKLSKLLYKQNQEIKELLMSNIDELEVSNWTLAYPNGEQATVNFYNPKRNIDEIVDRINLINKSKLIRHLPEGVFLAENMKDAERKFMEWYENTNGDDE